MNARGRAFELLPSSILATATILGVIAALQPIIALAAGAAVVLAYVVFSDLAVGFAVLAFLSFLDTLSSSSLSPAKAVGLLLVVAWLGHFSSTVREQRDFFAEHSHLTWVLIAFIGWGAVSLVWATQLGPGIASLSRYAPNMLLLPIAYTAVRTRRDLAIVLGAIVFGAIVAAGFGIAQPADASQLVEASSRATGTIGDPNELAAVLLVGLALGAGFALGRGRAPLMRIAGAIAVPLCAAGVFLSLSRGGLVAMGALLVAATIFAGRWRVAITAMLLAVAVGGVVYFTELAPLPARERVTNTSGGSGRSDLWTVGWRMVKAHPVTGVGVGNFQAVSADYVLQPGTITRADLIFSQAPKVTHNTYLEVMAEEGAPGLLLLLAVIVTCMACALRAARIWARRGQASVEALARSVFLGLVGMLTADFFISNMFSKLLWVMLALGPAMLAIARAESEEKSPEALAGQG
jgi:O-antigen ligase